MMLMGLESKEAVQSSSENENKPGFVRRTNCKQLTERIEAGDVSHHSEEIRHYLRNPFVRLPEQDTYSLDVQSCTVDNGVLRRQMDLLPNDFRVERSIRKDTCACSIDSNPHRDPLPRVHVRMLQPLSRMDIIRGDNFLVPPISGETSCLGQSVMQEGPNVHRPSFRSKDSYRSTVEKSTPMSPISPLDFNTENDNTTDDDEESSHRSYEVALATSDKCDLLNSFTNALSDCLRLSIQEAHVFRTSTGDGMALGLFVVETSRSSGYHNLAPTPEDLKQAILEILSTDKFDSGNSRRLRTLNQEPGTDVQLRSTVDDLTYGDWSIDFKNLEIGERLGGGSSGDLHRGRYLRRDVAIKIIHLEVDDDILGLEDFSATELLGMFRQEVLTMRLVRHKNIVQFIGACSFWPKLYIVTELMLGNVLQTRGSAVCSPASRANPVINDVRGSVKILRDAARGMDFLHRKGIMHRDLKAANLLVDEQGVVKVCDFGLSRSFGVINPAAVDSTDIGAFDGNWELEMAVGTTEGNFGTEGTLSRGGVGPWNSRARMTTETGRERNLKVEASSTSRFAGSEVSTTGVESRPIGMLSSRKEYVDDMGGPALMTGAIGTLKWMSPEVLMHKPYDHKADVYSFGILIWEVVTGEVPYAGLTPLQAALGVVNQGVRPIMPASSPPKLAHLAQQCWHQNPQQRPDFTEVAAALEELLSGPSLNRRKNLFRRKSKWLFTMGG